MGVRKGPKQSKCETVRTNVCYNVKCNYMAKVRAHNLQKCQFICAHRHIFPQVSYEIKGTLYSAKQAHFYNPAVIAYDVSL